jgi:acetyltransferase-like isoleucine patch superfamily enzyme
MRKHLIRVLKTLGVPRGLRYRGSGVEVKFPRRIKGGNYISMGQNAKVDSGAWIEAISTYAGDVFDPSIFIGRDVQIGRGLILTAIDRVIIGDGCLLSEQVYISDHAHDVKMQSEAPLVSLPLCNRGPVTIGRRCFIGMRAMVLGGVTLGEGCVVGAGAVVTRSFPDYSVIAGVPGRLIGSIKND